MAKCGSHTPQPRSFLNKHCQHATAAAAEAHHCQTLNLAVFIFPELLPLSLSPHPLPICLSPSFSLPALRRVLQERCLPQQSACAHRKPPLGGTARLRVSRSTSLRPPQIPTGTTAVCNPTQKDNGGHLKWQSGIFHCCEEIVAIWWD